MLETTVKDLNEKHKRDLSAALGTMKLQHQVDSSDMKATIEQQNKEIQTQCKLTENVAQAGQKSVTQNFCK